MEDFVLIEAVPQPLSDISHNHDRDLNLDTKLELLRSREHLEYTFRTLPEVKDGRYKGQWKNGKPSGR